MLDSNHPEIKKYVINYYSNSKSPVRDELRDKINAGDSVNHCTVKLPTDDSDNPSYREYSGYIFNREGKQLALISDHMDYMQDVLIDISKLDVKPTVGKPADIKSVLPETQKKKYPLNGEQYHRNMRHEYVQSLYKTCSLVMKNYVELRNTLPLPKLDDPMLAEMVKWKKTNSYQEGLLHECKHQLMEGLSTLSNINFLLSRQQNILPHVLSQIELPKDSFNITRGGLKQLNEEVLKFDTIAQYGFEISIHVPDDNKVEFIVRNHSLEEIARFTDHSGFEEKSVELNGNEYNVLCYELDPDSIEEMEVSGKLDSMPPELATVFKTMTAVGDHKGLRIISDTNSNDLMWVGEESSRQNGQASFALYNGEKDIAAKDLCREMDRLNDNFAANANAFARSHPDFIIPERKSFKREYDFSEPVMT